jgi:hypothetical protein
MAQCCGCYIGVENPIGHTICTTRSKYAWDCGTACSLAAQYRYIDCPYSGYARNHTFSAPPSYCP